MDITPQVINEVEFHQKMRGYDPDEVDDFLERVALAVSTLQERLQEAVDRLGTAERRASDLEARLKEAMARGASAGAAAPAAAAADDDVESISRTLVLAQRTADAAVREAEEAARQTIAAAREQAAKHHEEAQAAARKVLADAQAEAHASSAETRQRLVAEILGLEESRDALRADSGAMERFLEEQRLRLRAAVTDIQRVLDDPGRLLAASPPELEDRPRPAAVAEVAVEVSASAPIDGPAIADLFPAPDPSFRASQPADAPERIGLIDLADEAPPGPVTGGVTFTAADDTGEHDAFQATPGEDAAWARFVGDDDGPPTEAVNIDDDAYLAELRKAMVDEDAAEAWADDLERKSSRFGRRR